MSDVHSGQRRGGATAFQAVGRALHLRIRSAADLAAAASLDESHWVATSAPVASFHGDGEWLKLIDVDGDGKITCRELRQAICWLLEVLEDHAGIDAGSETLELSAVSTASPEGGRILEAAGKVLDRVGRADARSLTLDEVCRIKAHAEANPVSEAGVVLPSAAGDDALRRFITDVIRVTGGTDHPSGQRGLSATNLEVFLAAARDHLAWLETGRLGEAGGATAIQPLADATAGAFDALQAIRAKVDQYFAQCEAVALDPRLAERMGWTQSELAGLDFDDPSVIERVLGQAPLARASGDRRLRFEEPMNPSYLQAIDRLRREVLAPLGAESDAALSAARWQEVKAAFEPHRQWREQAETLGVSALPADTLTAHLGDRLAGAARGLIAESARTALVLDNLRLLEKTVLYQARILRLANNFVSFPHLYDPADRALFEMGTLVTDGRRLEFAVRVHNRAEHEAVARTSNMHVLYVAVPAAGGLEALELAIPVTSGGRGNLCVGKGGVFIDRAGRVRPARIVAMIENPIGFREAVVAPFRRLGKLLTGKIEALTADAENRFDASAAQVVNQPAAAAPVPPRTMGMQGTGGLVMGAGVAVAALGSAIAYITKTLAQITPLAIVAGVVVAAGLVILPTLIVAGLKLRSRDLSAILEGAGWAINARMRLTHRLATQFTHRPAYPRGARGVRLYRWRWLIVVAIVLALLSAGAWALREHRRRNQPTPAAQPTPGDPNSR